MRFYRLHKIRWDTDGKPRGLNLPKEAIVQVNDDFAPEEQAADLLSDIFGFCIYGCLIEPMYFSKHVNGDGMAIYRKGI